MGGARAEAHRRGRRRSRLGLPAQPAPGFRGARRASRVASGATRARAMHQHLRRDVNPGSVIRTRTAGPGPIVRLAALHRLRRNLHERAQKTTRPLLTPSRSVRDRSPSTRSRGPGGGGGAGTWTAADAAAVPTLRTFRRIADSESVATVERVPGALAGSHSCTRVSRNASAPASRTCACTTRSWSGGARARAAGSRRRRPVRRAVTPRSRASPARTPGPAGGTTFPDPIRVTARPDIGGVVAFGGERHANQGAGHRDGVRYIRRGVSPRSDDQSQRARNKTRENVRPRDVVGHVARTKRSTARSEKDVLPCARALRHALRLRAPAPAGPFPATRAPSRRPRRTMPPCWAGWVAPRRTPTAQMRRSPAHPRGRRPRALPRGPVGTFLERVEPRRLQAPRRPSRTSSRRSPRRPSPPRTPRTGRTTSSAARGSSGRARRQASLVSSVAGLDPKPRRAPRARARARRPPSGSSPRPCRRYAQDLKRVNDGTHRAPYDMDPRHRQFNRGSSPTSLSGSRRRRGRRAEARGGGRSRGGTGREDVGHRSGRRGFGRDARVARARLCTPTTT